MQAAISERTSQWRIRIAREARLAAIQKTRTLLIPHIIAQHQHQYLQRVAFTSAQANWLQDLNKLARIRIFPLFPQLKEKLQTACQHKSTCQKAFQLCLSLNLPNLIKDTLSHSPDLIIESVSSQLFEILSKDECQYYGQIILANSHLHSRALVCLAEHCKTLVLGEPFATQFYRSLEILQDDQALSMVCLLLGEQTDFRRLGQFKTQALRHILGESELAIRFLWGIKEAIAQGVDFSQQASMLIEKGLVLAMTRRQPLAILSIAMIKELCLHHIPQESHLSMTLSLRWLLQNQSLEEDECLGILIICKMLGKEIEEQAIQRLKAMSRKSEQREQGDGTNHDHVNQ